MRRAAVLMGLVGSLVSGCMGISAAEPSHAGPAMPYADYRAAEQAFVTGSAAASSSGIPDIADMRARMESALALWQTEGDRLAAAVPEPCYAAAHAELVAYRRDELANYRDAMPMLEGADSVMGLLPTILMVQAILQKAHPLAFPERSPEPGVVQVGGPPLDVMNILDALQTCEPAPS